MPSQVGENPVPGGSEQFLSSLCAGETARVVGVGGDDDVRRRLLEMGLTPGAIVRIVRFAPLGDPIELALRGYRLSVRRDEAKVVSVMRLDRSTGDGGA